MAEFDWTSPQLEAVRTTGRSVLVSAGAGSGKTAVLAERCAHLVSEADAPCNVDELLVVTFTDAAAAQMRERIQQILRDRLARSPNHRRLRYQLALLDTAQISTLHAFCRRVLNRYFTLANLDPQAPLLDTLDASLLRRETAGRVFDAFGQRDDRIGNDFLDFLAAYGGSDEARGRQLVLGIDAFLSSLPDPDAWIEAARSRFEPALPERLSEPWLKGLHHSLRDELAMQCETLDRHLEALKGCSPAVAGFVACLTDYREHLGTWRDGIDREPAADALDHLCDEVIRPYEPPSRPRLSKEVKELGESAVAEFERTRGQVKSIFDDLFKKRLRNGFARFTTADWAEGICRTAPHVHALLNVVGEARRAYHAAKAELGVIDFTDLERMTLDLLRDDVSGVAAALRRQFKHVLVDEFQDINPLQAEILRRVSHEAEPKRPGNLFVVGDIKQSIYRFRLAEPELFLRRQASFQVRDGDTSAPPAGSAIDLVENFRSRRPLIDAINALFDRLMARDLGGIDYDEHARLKCGLDQADPSSGPPVELHILEKPVSAAVSAGDEEGDSGALDWEQIQREAFVIAERVRTLVGEGRRYDEIVVLLRSMKARTGLLVRTLLQLEVPVFADVAGSLFESLEVLDLLSLLALLDNEQQDIPLAALLRSPLLGSPLTDSQLVTIVTAVSGPDAGPPFHEAVRRYARQGEDAALRSRLTAAFGRLADWRRRIRRRPVADVVWEIYEETGCLAYVSGLPEGPQRRANLLQLHEYARRFGTFKRQGLYRFLQFIDGLREAGVPLDAGSVAAPAGNVVRIMTIHRSKGLEFPVVILGELGKRFNLADARGSILFDRHSGVGMEAIDLERRIAYPTLPHRLVRRAVETESLAEELRVLYVALTRAKDRLILVGTGDVPDDFARGGAHSPPTAAGPLPLLQRRRAAGMLDWVVGAVASLAPEHVTRLGVRPKTPGAGRQSPPSHHRDGGATWISGHTLEGDRALFGVRIYPADEMKDWRLEREPSADATHRLECTGRFEPLPFSAEAASLESPVQRVARRLTTPYPADALTKIPAVVAASALKRRWNTIQDDEEPPSHWAGRGETAGFSRQRRFKTPDFIVKIDRAEPTERGTWTHEFLQRLDLSRSCDAADLRRQRDDMIRAGVLDKSEAQVVDLVDVAWFCSTPLGTRVRSSSTRCLREWPFTLGVDPRRYTRAAIAQGPGDLLLVRGIIDLLFDAGKGWEVLDYKTDDVTGDALLRRAADYAGQLDIYAAAVEAVFQRAPRKKWLVFLSAREGIEV